MDANEFTASIFLLIPVTFFSLVQFSSKIPQAEEFQSIANKILLIVFVLLIGPLLMTLASTARYCQEFMSILLMMSFLGFTRVKMRPRINGLLVSLAVLSILNSFWVVVNGLLVYQWYLRYKSPLIDILEILIGWHAKCSDTNSQPQINWFRQAAQEGNNQSRLILGRMFAAGLGVLKDESEASKWFRRAADQGNAVAQNNLGVMYKHGIGVAKDRAGAMKWLTKTADQGNEDAKRELRNLGK
jgi:hypothetical protein